MDDELTSEPASTETEDKAGVLDSSFFIVADAGGVIFAESDGVADVMLDDDEDDDAANVG